MSTQRLLAGFPNNGDRHFVTQDFVLKSPNFPFGHLDIQVYDNRS